MAEFTKPLLDMLTEFMICEIGTKSLDGITYSFVFKDKKDKATYEKYMTIKKTATDCGFSNDEVFRVYQVANGYIFDMDLNTAKQITAELAKSVAKNNGGQTPAGDIIKDMPEQRRKKDMVLLSKKLKEEYDKGNDQVEVALFSRNTTNKIIVTGNDPSGNKIAIKYDAYAIRHWDIEIVNEKFLIPAGFRVSRIQPCEILPKKTGISFLFTLEPYSAR